MKDASTKSIAPASVDRLGMLMVAGAAILFASKGLFAKALYQRDVGFELLVAVRAVIAMPLFVWIAVRANSPSQIHKQGGLERGPMSTQAIVAAALSGIVCYYVGAMLDFWALTLIDASIERVLLFSYPAMVVALGSIIKRRAPERRVVLAMLITYAGIYFAMGGIDFRELAQNLFGAGLVLIAALTTAIYFQIGDRYTHEIGSTRFAAIGMSSAAIMLALHFAVFRSFDEFGSLAMYDWFLLVVLGVACMFIPGLLQAEGMKRVGAQRASIASTIGPPTTIVLAALFLNERLNAWQVLGSAMIVGSVLVLSWPRSIPEAPTA
ncbi:MAG TPA: DMT family transporter [Steroidobacteraceae bacterium]|nr:DMT family transporter [Steroidobacteraceae bacterium]